MIDIIKTGIKREINELNLILNDIKIKQVEVLTVDIENETIPNFKLSSKNAFIYIIKSANHITKDNIENINNYKNDYAMCRINDNFDFNKDNCLYVGSSHNIKKRLIEHLGIGGSRKTYAMHLKKWWKYGSISIEIYSVENSDKCLQLYEDILWDYYKPLLGRQGKK